MPPHLLWLDPDDLFEDRPAAELSLARAALATDARADLVAALDLVGVHNARSYEIEEEDLITALQCALLGPAATGALAETWQARSSRARARTCPHPEAAALLRAAEAWTRGRVEPAWIYAVLARDEDVVARRGAICGILDLARADLDHLDRDSRDRETAAG